MRGLLACAALVLMSSGGYAQNRADLVISNGRIIDGNGTVIGRGSIVITDGRIVSVLGGPARVERARDIDAEGMTVMPGLIDAHRHVIRGEPTQWLAQEAPARMQQYLDAGFTSILSAADAEEILELRRRIEEGEITGPRLLAAGVVPLAGGPVGPAGGRPRGDGARNDRARPENRPTEPTEAIPAEQTRAMVRRVAEAGFDAVKTLLILSPNGPEKATLELIVDEAARHGLPTITHAVTPQDALAAVEAGVTTLVHTPVIGFLTQSEARTIASAGIPMMSTLGVFIPTFAADNQLVQEMFGPDDRVPRFRDLEPYPMASLTSAGEGPVNARLLWDAGITYGFGTDTSFVPRDSLAHELRPLRLVFSPQEIITMLTRNAAVAIGRAEELGTLERGKLADIVMLDGDPLQDIYEVLDLDVVIKGGEIVVDKL